MSKVIIRYKLRPEEVRENVRLLRVVFEELSAINPTNLTYEAYLLEDGVSFVHIVDSATDARAFGHLESYRAYRDTVAERCSEPPEMVSMESIGRFASPFG